jgi:hypothetical protein
MSRTSFAALRKFTGALPEKPPGTEMEHCELCSVRLSPQHRHLFETATRKILCSCDGCALRFENVVEGKLKLIPRDARLVPDFNISDAEWDALALPINLAFFFYSTPARKMIAMYPSPAGATESLLPLSAWERFTAQNAGLSDMQPDIEALLVNRMGEKRSYVIAPIDKCYELVGIIRANWRGLSGGEEVWRKIDNFFTQAIQSAR